MDLGLRNTLLPGDPRLIDHIVGEVKSQGIFDQFRKDALADVDTKPAYQNLRTRVEASVNSFLSKQTWKADLNKNQLRETLRKQISDAAYLDAGVERIVDQVVNPKIYSVFMPQIEDVVYKYLGLEKPKREKNGTCGLKDLLPIDLDPVSPESDKNSLKDVSLDSVDANLPLINDTENNTEENHDNIANTVDENVNGEVVDEIINNGHVENNEKSDEIDKTIEGSSTPPLPSQPLDENLMNDTAKSDDKTEEEEEEESPVFEPIDIMNLNESNISNDSHLSGISELTSHRSRSPDFANEFSRDNFDFSNQDSQFSKVSSDSRLSIVTDFGSSNPASTPISDIPKDDNKEKLISKDNFKAIRDESDKNKETKLAVDDSNKIKDNSLVNSKDLSSSSSSSNNSNNAKSSKNNLTIKESSRDGIDNVVKEKSEMNDKEKNHREVSKSKSSKERSDSRDSRSHRDRDRDHKKKSSSSDSKSDNSEKYKAKDKLESGRDTADKIKDSKDSISTKLKDDKVKESTISKEPKDLKDIYKEKIRELREKKELTEKEKLNKENKELSSKSSSKDSSHRRDSSKDKKEHRSSSSSSKSHRSKYESKSKSSSSSSSLSKDDKSSSRSSSKDKSRRDERKRDSKESKGRSQTESTDKSESRRSSKSERDEKSDGKSSQRSTSNKKISRSDSHSKNNEKSDSKRESESKDKKRRDDKKSKSKDDHPSLRKNSNDRRSSDRDGSNGSSGKGPTDKTNSTTAALNKETNNVSNNSNSETSSGVGEPLTEESPTSNRCIINKNSTISIPKLKIRRSDNVNNIENVDCGQNEISLPLKKRPLNNDDDNITAIASSSSSSPLTLSPSSPSSCNGITMKKPKFARNIHEAKKLIKIRKKLEKQKFLAQYNLEKKIQSQDESDETSSSSLMKKDVIDVVPDDERVQIIEVRPESDDELYPNDDTEHDMTMEQQSNVILNSESTIKSEILTTKSKLTEMELSIRESLNEMMSDDNLKDASKPNCAIEKSQNNITSKKSSKKKKYKNDIASSRRLKNKSKTSIAISNESKQFQLSDNEEDCLYFVEDNERLLRFTKFLTSLNNECCSMTNIDDKMSGDELESNKLISMAPPRTKRKYSASPLSDIILHNTNSNDEDHNVISTSTTAMTIRYDDENPMKKKKLGRPKKQRPSVSSSSPQSVTNGDHFVMPLSPDSDVSASSEKMPSQLTKDDKSRPRSNQHYTSDDLYKPRPLFVSSSRRNRRSNQS